MRTADGEVTGEAEGGWLRLSGIADKHRFPQEGCSKGERHILDLQI